MSGSKKSAGVVTDISTITSVTDVTVLHDIIVTFDKQVRRLEEDLSKVTDKINQIVEENTRFKDEIVCFKALDFAFKQTQAENVRLKARIIEPEHRLGKTSRNSGKPLRQGNRF